MSFMAGALCAACSSTVHEDRGRVACDGCDLPTGCCLCPPSENERRRAAWPARAEASGPRALTAGRDGPAPLRLAERILRHGCRAAPFAAADSAMPASALQGCRVVVADSVAVYAAALRSLDRRVSLARLPNLLPPAERCFIEMRGADDAIPAWGAYLVRLDLRAPRVLRKIATERSLRRGVQAAPASARWLVLSGLVVDNGEDGPLGPLLLHQLHLDDLGGVALHADGATSALATTMPRLDGTGPDPEHEVFKERCTRRYFMPIALALAFLNCEGSSLEPLPRPDTGAGPALEGLYVEGFERALARLTGDGSSPVEAARRLVPGRFEDDRGGPSHPGSTTGIRWRPETLA